LRTFQLNYNLSRLSITVTILQKAEPDVMLYSPPAQKKLLGLMTV